MPMEFEWDENKAKSNRVKHGIRFEDACYCLMIHNICHSKNAQKTVSIAGRHYGIVVILVAHTIRFESGNEIIRIISARKADRKERNRYEHG